MGVTVSLDCPRRGCPAWVMVSFEGEEPPAVYGKEARPHECSRGHRLGPGDLDTVVLRARRILAARDR